QALRIISADAAEQVDVSAHLFKNMIQRQEAQHLLVRRIGERETGFGEEHIAHNIAMREHYAFRRTRSTGSIDDRSHLLLADLRLVLFHLPQQLVRSEVGYLAPMVRAGN